MRRVILVLISAAVLLAVGFLVRAQLVPRPKELWRIPLKGYSPQPLLDKDGSVLVRNEREIVRINPDGKITWRITPQGRYPALFNGPDGEPYLRSEGSLYRIIGDRLEIVAKAPNAKASLRMLDGDSYMLRDADGVWYCDANFRKLWKSPGGAGLRAEPFGDPLLGRDSWRMVAIDRTSGKVLWSTYSENARSQPNNGALAVRGSKARLLDRAGKRVWEYDAGIKLNFAQATDACLWVGGPNGVFSLTPQGQLLASRRIASDDLRALDDGTLLIEQKQVEDRSSNNPTERSTLIALAPDASLRWRWECRGKLGTPVGSGNRMYLIVESALVGLELPQR